MSAICNNCGKPMPRGIYRACEECRADWRRYARKPGGPAETREILRELVAAVRTLDSIERGMQGWHEDARAQAWTRVRAALARVPREIGALSK